MITVGANNLAVAAAAADSARRYDVPARAVHLRLLLHLPRVASGTGTVPQSEALAEGDRLAARMPRRAEWRVGPVAKVSDLRLVPVDDAQVRDVCERFHYLGSHRTGGLSYGLVSRTDELVALGVTTSCDVDRLRQTALERFDDPSPRVLARVFAFDGAPHNCLSRLFSLLCRAERRLGQVSILTYVNPNMRFTGVSYRAAGWTLVGDEPRTTYRYLDGDYVTDRDLMRRVRGSKMDESALIEAFGARYRRSQMVLEPLRIFGRRL